MNDTDGTDARRGRAQATAERHKDRAKEMIRGAQAAPESRSAEPAGARQLEPERGSRAAIANEMAQRQPEPGSRADRKRDTPGASDRSESAPQGRPPAHAAAHGLRRQQGGEETPPADRRQQMVRGRVDRIKKARRQAAPERREPARDTRGRGPQERPGIAERIRMARSQPQQDQRSRP